MESKNQALNRRDFLRQSFAFSALAAGLVPRTAHAFAADPQARHVLLVGDWGKQENTIGQGQVAAAMVQYAKANKFHTEALFMLGDSWYGPLPGGVDDPRWKVQFEDMYPKSAFDCPAYSIMGNHDYQRMPADVSKRDAELAYARRGHTRWTQPALWYTFNLPMMKIIALDSNVPMGRKENGIDFTLTAAEQAEQLKWFTAELARPRTVPWLVVMGHHPIFSNGPHGDHPVLTAQWEPLLREHKAHLYLAGHDHDLQHLEFAGHPTSFVCSGAGGADLYNLKIAESARGPFADKVYGFTHMEITSQALTLRHIDGEGKVLHSFQKSLDGTVRITT
jgi:tartrate-resistant acid phosphatase type 5